LGFKLSFGTNGSLFIEFISNRLSSDNFMKILGNSPIKFSAFHTENEGYKFRIFSLSLTGNYKGNTYRFSMEPLNKEKGFNMVNLKITLDGKEKQKPKEI
jgi:hypothetical protein